MGIALWIRRFLWVFCLAFGALLCVHLVRGHELNYALSDSFLWGIISANIFIFSRIYPSRQGQQCALCNDTPTG